MKYFVFAHYHINCFHKKKTVFILLMGSVESCCCSSTDNQAKPNHSNLDRIRIIEVPPPHLPSVSDDDDNENVVELNDDTQIITVIIEALNGEKWNISCNSRGSILQLKQLIAKITGNEVQQQRIIFHGQELTNNEQLLSNYYIKSGSKLHLVVRRTISNNPQQQQLRSQKNTNNNNNNNIYFENQKLSPAYVKHAQMK